MKKAILMLAVFVAASFTSCKKDRICTCVDQFGFADVKTYTKSRKRDARTRCMSYTVTNNNVIYTTTCTLK